ncbi:MAG: hypothetical protein WA087_00635 [Candidatus Saccharimonadales bacterium]
MQTIKDRLNKIKYIDIKADLSSLTADQKTALSYVVKAAKLMDGLYLHQACVENEKIINNLQDKNDEESKDLLQYFMTQGTPWDSYQHNQSFIPEIGKKPLFGSFYPEGLTKDEWSKWLDNNPADRPQFESNYTVIKRDGDELRAVPYSMEYSVELKQVAKYLRQAAGYLEQGSLKTFLEKRADSFENNDYFDSEMVWVDTTGEPFEVTIGPYEVYFDELMGVKAAFESYIGIADREATDAIAKYKSHIQGFNELLQSEFNFEPKGLATPMIVTNDIMRSGMATFGYIFVAFNLPNDRRVHELKGSKKVFSKTMMETKFSQLSLPAAKKLLASENFEKLGFEGYLQFVIGHEIAHGCGPATVTKDGKAVSFDVTLEDLYSTIEEAKADMLGIRFLKYLTDQNVITQKELEEAVIARFAICFIPWSHGFTEAHSKGELMEYNWLESTGAITYNSSTKQFLMNTNACIDEMTKLSTEFLNIEMSGNYQTAKEFVEKWGTVPPELVEAIGQLGDIPTAIKPIWDISELE